MMFKASVYDQNYIEKLCEFVAKNEFKLTLGAWRCQCAHDKSSDRKKSSEEHRLV